MAFDTFMVFPKSGSGSGGITVVGESTDKTFGAQGALEIYSFSWGASNPVTIGSGSGGTGGGKVSLSSFNIMKKVDSSSPALFTACATGAHFDNVKVVLRKAGGTQVSYLVYGFSEMYVESIQFSGSSGGDDTPTESVSFAFGQVQMTYTPQLATGAAGTKPMTSSWNTLTNVKDVTISLS